ncbi:helix-turn-helix domain-containing protein [Streptomyces mobaraensis]|uniref:Helix-turn-helix transcriptional regulator n=1 Tax=Streptomyces mobaraensis TaxID=35621 RepID=A0A5N5WCY9_STRMB|nr:helix-turn-helix transcriptional regulator [Streptomyces mobaraensis]KAB7850198.1 helix-turn-helix transcriptional regulator [Streptomyces mobaraensis]
MYRLRVDRLLDAAKVMGDKTGYAIARRTKIAESSVYRILGGKAQPDLISMLRIAEVYDVRIEGLMERIPEEAA